MCCERSSPRGVSDGPRVFAECCSLTRVGASHGTEDNNVLAPGTQPGKCVFESCLTLPPSPLTWIKLVNLEDCLKGRSVMHALNSSACRVTSTISGRVPVKIVKALVELNLMDTEITALPSSTFAHCVALNSIWLPPRLTLMGKEATVHFVGVNKVQCFTPLDWSDIEQWMQSEHNAFFMCDKFEKPQWVELLSAEDLIQMLLTRNSTTNIAKIMSAHVDSRRVP